MRGGCAVWSRCGPIAENLRAAGASSNSRGERIRSWGPRASKKRAYGEPFGENLELNAIVLIATLRVPTATIVFIGMRKLAKPPIVKRALETLKGRARVKHTMWSRRAQEYEAKINSGGIVAIAEVVRAICSARTLSPSSPIRSASSTKQRLPRVRAAVRSRPRKRPWSRTKRLNARGVHRERFKARQRCRALHEKLGGTLFAKRCMS